MAASPWTTRRTTSTSSPCRGRGWPPPMHPRWLTEPRLPLRQWPVRQRKTAPGHHHQGPDRKAIVKAHPLSHRRTGHSPRVRGFTLVELMIGITLGLFIMIGLISLLVSNVASRSELDKSSRQIENGRYAVQLLRE